MRPEERASGAPPGTSAELSAPNAGHGEAVLTAFAAPFLRPLHGAKVVGRWRVG